MQPLSKPTHSRPSSPLQSLPLHIIIPISPRRKPMGQARKINILVGHIIPRNHNVTLVFQLLREREIVFRGENLRRHR